LCHESRLVVDHQPLAFRYRPVLPVARIEIWPCRGCLDNLGRLGLSCPLLAGPGCELVDRAHGIVFVLDLDRLQHRSILERYRQVTLPSVPIRAVVRPGQRQQYADLLADFEVWEHEPNAADLDGFSAEVEAAERLR
jgi:hypothetical protein